MSEPLVVAQFDYVKSTQSTYRFREIASGDGKPVLIGDLYIKQASFEGRKPKRIRVVVEEVEVGGASSAEE